ncbi:aminoglycoside phosphotransferase [Paenibacillus sp. A3]|uniref:phosphotransferase enzyme family protein n=1 Tax=Paenibacillus sp. A3 TaxID=1337054 RepID=UPI0006D58B03|nr:phosphotransferase [Paenibacillus sp. A3]KPV55425.1 aminoglycoside phosphotransferase [Paenibacillus sp. A3]
MRVRWDDESIAKEALKQFPVHGERLVYLGKSDNVTFQVKTKQESLNYLMKLHYATKGIHSKKTVESELLWLEALAADTTLTVPSPVRNRDNGLTTEVAVNASGESVIVTVHHWVNGELLDREPTPGKTRSLAQLMAALHRHAMEWNAPAGFTRPVYDTDNVLSLPGPLKRLPEMNVISGEAYACLERTAHKIVAGLQLQTVAKSTWGLIHSDLHESNYVFDQGIPRPIDFSACGYGYYLFDVAETFLHLSPENRREFLSAYREERQMQEFDAKSLDLFFVWAILRNFAFLANNPAEHASLSELIPRVAKSYFENYLKDEPVLGIGNY